MTYDPTPTQKDMSNYEKYEALADAFYRATGKIAPGKSVPLEMGGDDIEERFAAWDAWLAVRRTIERQKAGLVTGEL